MRVPKNYTIYVINLRKGSPGVVSACSSELWGKFGRLLRTPVSLSPKLQEFRLDDDDDDTDNFYWMFTMWTFYIHNFIYSPKYPYKGDAITIPMLHGRLLHFRGAVCVEVMNSFTLKQLPSHG